MPNPCKPAIAPSIADTTKNGVRLPDGEVVLGKSIKVDNTRPGPKAGKGKKDPPPGCK